MAQGKGGGPKRTYLVGTVHRSAPDANGVRVLTMECDDGRGLPTRWIARCTSKGKVLGCIRLEEQDRISRHAVHVRAVVNRLALEAVNQTELPFVDQAVSS